AHSSGSAVKSNQRFAVVDLQVGEALGAQPVLEGLDIGFSRTESLAELLRSQPGVVVAGLRILLIGEELVKRGFLGGTALEQERHSGYGLRERQGTAVICRAGHRMHVAAQGGEFVAGNGLHGARLRWRLRGKRGGADKSGSERHTNYTQTLNPKE